MLTPELIAYCLVSFIAGAGLAVGACILALHIRREKRMVAMETAMSGGPDSRKWEPADIRDLWRQVDLKDDKLHVVKR